jgi:Fic family protein
MGYLSREMQKRLDDKLALLNSLRPLPSSAVRKLRDQFGLELTYNSNAIEGNSLTLKETFLVINEGLTIKGKPLKDHLEAKSHTEALEYMYELVDKDKRSTLSELLIRELNQIVVRDVDQKWAGRYRNSRVIIGGAEHAPPEAVDVPRLMQSLIDWMRKKRKTLHPVELAAILHHRLANIHPFFDGNGRTSRLVMNIILMQAGFPLVVVLKNDRKKYYRTLAEADKGNYFPFVLFIAQAVQRSLDIYIKTLTPAKMKKEQFVPLVELATGSRFTGKYLNLLARSGRLEAHKEGRNWLSSKEALNRYLDGRMRKRK